MSKISEHIQKADLGAEITLYQLDLSRWSAGTFYWISGDEGDIVNGVSFNGQAYTPFPIQAEGFEVTTLGPFARPTLTVANTSGIFTPLVLAYDNLRGATFTRLRTFGKFLDDGEDPDEEAIYQTDVYEIRRKIAHKSRQYIRWELAASIDLVDTLLPGRQIVRDFCDQAYRVWNPLTETFDYSKATCPHVTATYFTEQDVATSAANDQCGKRLSSCKARFGANNELPFRGFPGVARTRVK